MPACISNLSRHVLKKKHAGVLSFEMRSSYFTFLRSASGISHLPIATLLVSFPNFKFCNLNGVPSKQKVYVEIALSVVVVLFDVPPLLL